MSMILFYVGENAYAIESRYIMRILPKVELKKMPTTLPYIEGFLNLGGKAIPIIDSCQLIEQRSAQDLLSSRIILIKDPSENSERVAGILGEKIKDFINVRLEEFKPIDFSLSPFPFLNRVLSIDNEIIQYLDIATFFRFLSADLFQPIEKERHGS